MNANINTGLIEKSDFENAFRTLIPIFSIIFNDLSANESHLFRKSFDNFIDRNDFLIYPKIEGEVFPGNFCYSHKDNATYLSAKVIIEGYARIIELCLFYFEFKGILGDQLIDIMLDIDEVQNEVDFAKLLDSIENEYHHFFIQYLREKTEGVYGCTIKILKKLLNHISNTSDFFETCIAIHELSLMTDFAPNSIYTTNKDVNLLDFLIPHRFVSAMRFFVDEKTSIRGMGNEEAFYPKNGRYM